MLCGAGAGFVWGFSIMGKTGLGVFKQVFVNGEVSKINPYGPLSVVILSSERHNCVYDYFKLELNIYHSSFN